MEHTSKTNETKYEYSIPNTDRPNRIQNALPPFLALHIDNATQLSGGTDIAVVLSTRGRLTQAHHRFDGMLAASMLTTVRDIRTRQEITKKRLALVCVAGWGDAVARSTGGADFRGLGCDPLDIIVRYIV